MTQEQRTKLEHQLFIGKVSELIGLEKTAELLKECKVAFKMHTVTVTADAMCTYQKLTKNHDKI